MMKNVKKTGWLLVLGAWLLSTGCGDMDSSANMQCPPGVDPSECHGVPIDDPNHACDPESLDFNPQVCNALTEEGNPDETSDRLVCEYDVDEDADQDGLSNGEEDPNGNCIHDLDEPTDWLNPDTDGDGILDGDEGVPPRRCLRDMERCL